MRATLLLIVAALAVASPAAAQHADLSGMWILQDPGSGDWQAWYDNVPKPQLRPETIKDNEEIAARDRAGFVVNRAPRRPDCPVGNLPMMMASSPPLNIVAARDEVLIGAESSRGRFVYTDGRPHPDVKSPAYVASGFGHSIGRWEGDTLVVDTTNFSEKTRFRGSTPNLHIVERFSRRDPQTLLYRFTIEDPDTWTTAWTGEYTWPATDELMYEYACHEGNYALGNILRGARLKEVNDAKKTSSKQQ